MKAARFYEKGDIRVEEIPEPVPEPDEVLLAIEWCGICGSDIHEFIQGPIHTPSKNQPHALTNATVPVTLGHEFCGRIISAPEGSKYKPNQPVVADPRLRCRPCYKCTEPLDISLCSKWGFIGLSGEGGGFSSVVAVKESMLYPLPSDELLETAAVIEPLTTTWHAVRKCEVKDWSDKTVLILGGGPISVALIFVLRANKATNIFVSEPTAERRTLVKELVEEVFDPKTANVPDRCKELTGGRGVDIVFDCAGIERAMLDGMSSLKWNGLYMNIALWEKPFTMPVSEWIMKEIAVKASIAYTSDDYQDTVVAFCDGKFKGVEKMITGRIRLVDIVEKGFKELVANKDKHVKILVSPHDAIKT